MPDLKKLDFFLTDREAAALKLGVHFFAARSAAFRRKWCALWGLSATCFLAFLVFWGEPEPNSLVPLFVALFALVQAWDWWQSTREFQRAYEVMEKIVMSVFKESHE